MDTWPDLSARPYEFAIERRMSASPAAIYRAWTERFDLWFAAPGTVSMTPTVGSPWFFESHFDGNRHPHYGRFLALVPDERVETTWVTGEPGTRGAETVVTVELEATADGTMLILSHAGFADAETCKGHAEAWPEGLAHLDRCLTDES